MNRRILVAGIGNIFLGDDAFGVEVVRELKNRPALPGALVKDFGIRGIDLAYALLDPWDAIILVDALPRGGVPGTLYTLQPDLDQIRSALPDAAINTHGMDPVTVLRLAASLGEVTAQIFVLGCEPADFGDELEGHMGLSLPVQAAVAGAAEMVEGLIHGITAEHFLEVTP